MRRPHPRKEIEAALQYAESNGWVVQLKKGNGHAWGRMYCPDNDADCRTAVAENFALRAYGARLAAPEITPRI
jgi:hypothetical protein